MTNRRKFLGFASTAAALNTSMAWAQSPTSTQPPVAATRTGSKPDPTTHDMSGIPKDWMGNEKIAMLLYPGFTALDLVGPQYMFGNLMGAQVQLVSRTLEPVMSDTKLAIVPNATYADVPQNLDILFIPGAGSAIFDVMQDAETMAFIKDRAKSAKWVASVCTGSVILGQAGLLRGKRATSHWISQQELAVFGAIPVNERVVWDGNLVTGAGVSAGLDLGLQMIGRLKGDFFAESVQLLAEYDPQPPYRSGSLGQAKPQVRSLMEGMFKGYRAKIRSLIP
jgi:cyclohexyl-isocyanide hydratase